MTEHSPLQGKTPDRAGYKGLRHQQRSPSNVGDEFFIGAPLDHAYSTS